MVTREAIREARGISDAKSEVGRSAFWLSIAVARRVFFSTDVLRRSIPVRVYWARDLIPDT